MRLNLLALHVDLLASNYCKLFHAPDNKKAHTSGDVKHPLWREQEMKKKVASVDWRADFERPRQWPLAAETLYIIRLYILLWMNGKIWPQMVIAVEPKFSFPAMADGIAKMIDSGLFYPKSVSVHKAVHAVKAVTKLSSRPGYLYHFLNDTNDTNSFFYRPSTTSQDWSHLSTVPVVIVTTPIATKFTQMKIANIFTLSVLHSRGLSQEFVIINLDQ